MNVKSMKKGLNKPSGVNKMGNCGPKTMKGMGNVMPKKKGMGNLYG